MSSFLVLPAPLPSTALTLGQLITDPLSSKSESLKPSTAPPSKQTTYPKHKDTIIYDDNGRFTSTHSFSNSNQASSHANLLDLTAEQMTHTTLEQPNTFFNQLRRDTATRTFLRKMTQEQTPVYFVTSIHTVRNPVFKKGSTEDRPGSPHLRLPVRRVDSASDITSSTKDPQQQDEECVLAVELLKVKCRVGASNEPHDLSDIEYSWSYHAPEELEEEEDGEEQLSIGLGKPLEANELRALAGMPLMEDTTAVDEGWDERSEYSDDGIGGF
ncbi:uncharacterized protein yc1106_07429 [Curvularia clavata]|uniref:Uncharacterized protein n=1 Tax=Curvularia clavata TaxID=95742 RepID=A0A9Q9DVN6_CURCL|nr:uncharacterized protein yc1106_07429 [Curvularia clavata]